MSWTAELLSYLNLFLFRTWARGGWTALPGMAGDSISLTMIPPLVVSLKLVYCLHVLLFSNKIVCCGIFDWAIQTLHIWSIYFPISSLKLMSLLYLVMYVFGPNDIGSPSPLNYINQPNHSPLSIVTFGVHPRSLPPLGTVVCDFYWWSYLPYLRLCYHW